MFVAEITGVMRDKSGVPESQHFAVSGIRLSDVLLAICDTPAGQGLFHEMKPHGSMHHVMTITIRVASCDLNASERWLAQKRRTYPFNGERTGSVNVAREFDRKIDGDKAA